MSFTAAPTRHKNLEEWQWLRRPIPRSILRWLSCREGGSDCARRPIALLYANRSEDAIPFRDELDELKPQLPGLRVVDVISRPGEDWPGYRGRIGADLLDRELPASACAYYVSGPPSFNETMQAHLVATGVRPDDIKTEWFVGY